VPWSARVSSIRLFTYAAILVCVVATSGFLVGIWGTAAALAVGNIGWGFWLSAGYLYLIGEGE
jgi:hypothetical protein